MKKPFSSNIILTKERMLFAKFKINTIYIGALSLCIFAADKV